MLHDAHQPEHGADDPERWRVAGGRLEHLGAVVVALSQDARVDFERFTDDVDGEARAATA